LECHEFPEALNASTLKLNWVPGESPSFVKVVTSCAVVPVCDQVSPLSNSMENPFSLLALSVHDSDTDTAVTPVTDKLLGAVGEPDADVAAVSALVYQEFPEALNARTRKVYHVPAERLVNWTVATFCAVVVTWDHDPPLYDSMENPFSSEELSVHDSVIVEDVAKVCCRLLGDAGDPDARVWA